MPPDDFEEWLSDLTPKERKKFDDKVLRIRQDAHEAKQRRRAGR